jgi:hypothetical protein
MEHAGSPDSPRSQHSRGTIGSLGAVPERAGGGGWQQEEEEEQAGRTVGRIGMQRLTQRVLAQRMSMTILPEGEVWLWHGPGGGAAAAACGAACC